MTAQELAFYERSHWANHGHSRTYFTLIADYAQAFIDGKTILTVNNVENNKEAHKALDYSKRFMGVSHPKPPAAASEKKPGQRNPGRR